MISYAQNFEDVMLFRALKYIAHGFYVDVGAFDPQVDSVTKAFYDLGWSGINIEPNPTCISKFHVQRPRDINLEIAIADQPGEASLQIVSNPGLSSLDKSIAQGHSTLGWQVEEHEVKVSTLKEVFTQFCTGRDIHFLKIDVEGLEKAVILGNDWQHFRPWVLVIEATKPMSQEDNFVDWEGLLLGHNYVFVYADGLNRFYVAKEHSDLKAAFKYPPNVFDGFILGQQQETKMLLAQAEARVTQAEARVTQAEARVTQAEARVTQAEGELASLLNSLSWRITAPLRRARALLKRLSRVRLKVVLRFLIRGMVSLASRYERPKRSLIRILNRFPRLKLRLRRLLGDKAALAPTGVLSLPTDYADLTHHGRQIYDDLNKAIARQLGDK